MGSKHGGQNTLHGVKTRYFDGVRGEGPRGTYPLNTGYLNTVKTALPIVIIKELHVGVGVPEMVAELRWTGENKGKRT